MTSFKVERFRLQPEEVATWQLLDHKHANWPVVYTLNNSEEIYVGESLNGALRLRQHLSSQEKQHLEQVQVVLDDTYNKSVCLDLESFLIELFAGDGKFQVLNRNDGIRNAEYFGRDDYQRKFSEVFEELRAAGYFTRSIPQIQNSDLFKLSPFKALTTEQATAVEDILSGLFTDIQSGAGSTIVVQGNPGTGKTILAIYLLKLLGDISQYVDGEELESDSIFSEFFVPEHRSALQSFRIALVVPQQSLRASIQAVFAKVPGLDPRMVMTAFEVGESTEPFDLLIVDETHRLNRRSAQAMGTQTKQFADINAKLFGLEGSKRGQLDWIVHQSTHQVFLVDADQAVRPADLPRDEIDALTRGARATQRWYPLASQMRVKAGSDYVGFTKRLLRGEYLQRHHFGEYELLHFDDFDEMYARILEKEREHGLARLVAGYAWKWRSRTDNLLHDIALGSHQLKWNGTTRDWINSKNSINEVGSIHTVQGYDLNYAGVIIGGDLVYDEERGETRFVRSSYFDARGKANNHLLGQTFSDEDVLKYVRNIYSVLMTRGIRGTYLYVVDPALRRVVQRAVESASASPVSLDE